jgi:hypothetical protein
MAPTRPDRWEIAWKPGWRCCVAPTQGRLKANLGWDRIAKTGSSNATATRRLVGSSTASSQCPRRRFCTKPCPAMITLELRSCLSPRIGRSLAFSLPWSHSTPRLLAYRSVRCQAAGSRSSSTAGYTGA